MLKYVFGLILYMHMLVTPAFAAPEFTNFQAHIAKPNGYPLESNAVTFTFKYKNLTDNCTLFVETYANIDMTGSGGAVNLILGSGAPSFPVSSVTLYDIFNNQPSNTMACLEGGTYAPLTSNEGRLFIVEFSYPGSNGTQTIAGTTINSVPYAMYASQSTNSEQLGGYAAVDYARFADFGTCTGGQYLSFNGTSFSCTAPGAPATFTGSLSGDITGTQTTTYVSKLQNIPLSIASPSSGEALIFNGTAWISAPITSGTVTEVSSDNTYITVSNPNSTPTLSVNVGTGAGSLAAGDDSRITGAWQASSSLSGDVTGTLSSTVVSEVGGKTSTEVAQSVTDTQAATSSNDPSTIVKRDSSGNISLSGVSATNHSGRNYYLYDNTGTDRILLKAPNALASGDYSFTLPVDGGSSGYVLATDGSGNTSWIPASTGSVVSVTASAPLIATGTTSVDISLAKADATHDGYLSSSDWSIFNNKQNTLSAANVTTDGYLTSSDWSIFNNKQDALVAADGTHDGYLTSADWSIFNNKQDALVAADAAHDGYLTSADWTTFNNKLAFITSGDVITALGYTPGNAAGTLNTLNGQTGTTQSFAVGSTGSDFAINSSGDVHTFDLPTASAGARGLLSSSDWSFFNNKQDALVAASGTTDGYLTSTDWSLFNNKQNTLSAANATTDGYLTSSDWSIFNSKQDSLVAADATHNGYLTSTDWTIFNNKQNTLSAANATTDGYLTSSDWSIFNGKQDALVAADTAHDGYLTSADWTTFNNKLAFITSGDIITALGYTPGNAAGSLSTLNGQTGTTQSFSVGSTGSDFAINSSGDVHTFDIPTAGAGARGLLSSADWSSFSAKQDALSAANATTDGYLTSSDWSIFSGKQNTLSAANATTDGYLTSTDWSIFNNKQDALVAADGTHDGYLTSADWTTFNNKISGITSGDVITALGYTPGNAAGSLSTLNGQTGTTQSFAVGSAGSDFVISSSGDVHTFDIPTAGAGARGLLSSTDWSSFSAKQDALSAANATTDGYLTSSDWSIFNNKQDSLVAADAAHDGYLTSTDWSIFNSKQNTLSAANATTDGYLTSADWTTFNNKLAFITSSDIITALGYTPGNAAGSLSTLNGQTGTTQIFATSTSGDDFSITSSADVHTFNLPTASAGARGLLSSADWSSFSAKQDALVAADATHNGYLTSADWSIFNNKQNALVAADATHDGYLTSTDWTVFNNKLSAITSTDVQNALSLGNGFVRSSSGVLSASALTSTDVTDALGYTPSAGSGLTSLNGQLGTVQTFSVGSAGSDFAISSSGDVHTFDIPTASAGARGLLSSSDWSSFSAKQDALVAADGTHDGYLTSTDWTAFNSKLSSIDSTDITTALGYTPVNRAGDTMTGALNLPVGGLTVGTNQLAVNASGDVSTSGSILFPGGTIIDSSLIGSGHNDLRIYAPDYLYMSSGYYTTIGQDGLGGAESNATWIKGQTVRLAPSGTSVWIESGKVFGTNNGGAITIGNAEQPGTGASTINLNQNNVTYNVSKLSTESNADMILDPGNGNVGIRNGSPLFALDVSGDVNVTGSFKVNGVDIATGGGTVTSVTTSAPLMATGTTSVDISLAKADGSTDGYLSSSDWTIFNNKQNALSAANATTNGYLTSTDWTTFNNKLSSIDSADVTTALGYTPVNRAGDTMTGALNLPSGGLTVGTNQLAVTVSGNVGVGTSSPLARLHTSSDGSVVGAIFESTTSSPVEPNLRLKSGSATFDMSLSNSGTALYVNTSANTYWGTGSLFLTGGDIGTNSGVTKITQGGNFIAGWNGAEFSRDGDALGYSVKSDRLTLQSIGNSQALALKTSGDITFNTATIELARITSGGNVGIGVTSPTATLHLKAGTTAANSSPLKFTAGPVMDTPENGAIEFDGTNLFFTSNNVRYVIPGTNTSNDFSNVGSIFGSGALTIGAGGTNQNLTLQGSGTGAVTTPSQFTVTNSTDSTSPTNGAVVITGGVGVGGSMNVSGDITSNSTITANNFAIPTSGDLIFDDRVGQGTVRQALLPNGNLVIQGKKDWSSYTNIVQMTPNGGLSDGKPYLDLGWVTTVAANARVDFHIDSSPTPRMYVEPNGVGYNVPILTPWAGTLQIKGLTTQDAAGTVIAAVDTDAAITTAGAKLMSFRNNAVEKASIGYDGGANFSGKVGIGTASPNYKLELSGTTSSDRKMGINGTQVLYLPDQSGSAFLGSLFVGNGGGSLSHTTGTEGYYNTAHGISALNSISTGYGNTATGAYALYSNAGSIYNTAIGYSALQSNTGHYNTASGVMALGYNGTGSHNTASGYRALIQNSTGAYNIGIGNEALFTNSTGGSNVSIGFQSMLYNSAGGANVAIGRNALRNVTGNNNTAIGYGAGGSLTSGSNNIAIGYGANVASATSNDQLSIGNVIYGNLSTGNIGIGTSAPGAKLDVNGLIKSTATSATVYVDYNAVDDSGDGLTTGTAKKTLGAAFNLANALLTENIEIYVLNTNSSNRIQVGAAGVSIPRHKTITFAGSPYIDWDYVVNLYDNTNLYIWGVDILLNANMLQVAGSNSNVVIGNHGGTARITFNQNNLAMFTSGMYWNSHTVNLYSGYSYQTNVVTVTGGVTGSKINNPGGWQYPLRVYVHWNDQNLIDLANVSTDNCFSDRDIYSTFSGINGSNSYGIGTATPDAKLEVNGSSTNDGRVAFTVTDNEQPASLASLPLSSGLGLSISNNFSGAHGEVDFINRSGAGSNKGFRFVQQTGTGTFQDLVSIKGANGYVGIGIMDPQYALDVSGDIHITGTPYRDGGDITWQVPSDSRLKDITQKYDKGLREIASLDTVKFKYKKDNPKNISSDKEYTGIIAQELQKQIPEAVQTDKDGYLSVNTTPVFWAIVNAIKELFGITQQHEREIANVKAENEKLKKENAEIKERLERIEKALQSK